MPGCCALFRLAPSADHSLRESRPSARPRSKRFLTLENTLPALPWVSGPRSFAGARSSIFPSRPPYLVAVLAISRHKSHGICRLQTRARRSLSTIAIRHIETFLAPPQRQQHIWKAEDGARGGGMEVASSAAWLPLCGGGEYWARMDDLRLLLNAASLRGARLRTDRIALAGRASFLRADSRSADSIRPPTSVRDVWCPDSSLDREVEEHKRMAHPIFHPSSAIAHSLPPCSSTWWNGGRSACGSIPTARSLARSYGALPSHGMGAGRPPLEPATPCDHAAAALVVRDTGCVHARASASSRESGAAVYSALGPIAHIEGWQKSNIFTRGGSKDGGWRCGVAVEAKTCAARGGIRTLRGGAPLSCCLVWALGGEAGSTRVVRSRPDRALRVRGVPSANAHRPSSSHHAPLRHTHLPYLSRCTAGDENVPVSAPRRLDATRLRAPARYIADLRRSPTVVASFPLRSSSSSIPGSPPVRLAPVRISQTRIGTLGGLRPRLRARTLVLRGRGAKLLSDSTYSNPATAAVWDMIPILCAPRGIDDLVWSSRLAHPVVHGRRSAGAVWATCGFAAAGGECVMCDGTCYTRPIRIFTPSPPLPSAPLLLLFSEIEWASIWASNIATYSTIDRAADDGAQVVVHVGRLQGCTTAEIRVARAAFAVYACSATSPASGTRLTVPSPSRELAPAHASTPLPVPSGAPSSTIPKACVAIPSGRLTWLLARLLGQDGYLCGVVRPLLAIPDDS
ncbi:hypothetical protein B0H14DRAFT_3888517 [Mycena olivaceomarginata]|nr:hypothetical protein B0H14DRAFT_3888517 [Mycena olivaceomarginata]